MGKEDAEIISLLKEIRNILNRAFDDSTPDDYSFTPASVNKRLKSIERVLIELRDKDKFTGGY